METLTRLTPAAPSDPSWKLVTGDDAVELYDADGQLLRITYRGGRAITLQYTGGALQSVSDGLGRSLLFTYDAQARLSGVSATGGETVNYTYGTNGNLVSATYVDGKSRQYLYENPSFPRALTGIINEAGDRFATWTYDAQGRAVSSEHAGGVERYTLEFGPDGQGVTVRDPLGTQRQQQHANVDGRLIFAGSSLPCANCVGDAASNVIDPASGLVTQSTDYLGFATQMGWDTTRKLPVSVTRAASRPEAQTVQTQWHPVFRLPVLVTEPGRTTAYTYDAQGNKLSETVTDSATGQARSWAWTYTPQGLVASHTDPRGALWSYTYDAQGNRLTQTNPLGHVTAWQYDAAGRPTQQTEPNGLVTTYSYDLRGRLTSTSRGGETNAFSWTATGLLASASQPNGYSISYQYDAAQRLTGATDNRGNSVAYTLDGMGNRTREEVRDAGGAIALVTSRVINSLNKVSAISGAVGQTTQLGYDANGEPIAQTDPLNQTTRQTLDALRRPVATTLPDNAAATQAWNQLDQLTQVTDPKGVATQYSRNAFGEVVSETSPDIGTQSYQRDAAGDVSAITDAKGLTTQITRDALGRPVQVTRGAQHQTVYTWDQGQTGTLSQIEDPSGVTSYTRDALGRILAKTQTVNDNPANPASFTTRYSYQGGELASIEYPSGLKLFYQRSAAGQIIGMSTQLPGGTVKKPKPVVPFVSNLTHTALGQPKAWNWANGDSAARSFDSDGRMTGNEFASYGYDAARRITSLTQNLWASSTATGTVTLYTTPLSWTAGYDSRNRLTSFNRNGSEASYTYDANSNRLTAIDKTTSDTDLDGDFDDSDFSKSTAQALSVDPASNKLLGFTQTLTKVKGTKTVSTVSSNVAYSLDANGALTSDGLRGFDYDNANRLSKISIVKDGEAAKVRYLHNALGQRTFKGEPEAEQTLPNETELGQDFISWLKSNFKWLFAQAQANTSIGTGYTFADGHLPEWAVLGEYDNGSAAGKGRTEYIWMPTEDGGAIPVGMFRNGKFFAIHTDHLGTPRLVTNEDNKPVWQWPYSAFGSNKPTGILKATPNPKAAITNQPVLLKATAATEMNLRFPGQYADDEAGSFYNYQRSYLASQGRYTQNDPIGLGGGLNRFAYVGGNPLRYTDPKGLAVPVAVAACLANPACAMAMAAAAAATTKACIDTYNALDDLVFSRPKNPPDIGPPNGWIQGPRRGRQYGPDGRPQLDIDRPHQGNEQDHAHEWPDGKREEPGRPVSPWPRQ
ncbi:MAG: RHS repeat-associated core domain-containing protein [Ramlibacter sp.]